MNLTILLVVLLSSYGAHSELTSSPYMGDQEEEITLDMVKIEEQENGGVKVTVFFTTTGAPELVWHVAGKPVLYDDTNFFSSSSYNFASLYLGAINADKTISFSAILSVTQERVLIRLDGARPDTYQISHHRLVVNPAETFTYGDGDIVDVDAVLVVEVAHKYKNLRIKPMIIIPDYCSRPILPLFGFKSSHPQMIQVSSADRDQEFLGDADWSSNYPADQSVAKRIHITSVTRSSQRQGMLVVGSEFEPNDSSDPIRNVNTIRRVYFKPEASVHEFILKDTVTLIGWQKDVEVDLHGEADFNVFAIGNPAPRIMIAKDGVDLSTTLARKDVEEAYYKHTTFRFRNVTVADSGRYLCTAVSGDGRVKESFTLYVRTGCN